MEVVHCCQEPPSGSVFEGNKGQQEVQATWVVVLVIFEMKIFVALEVRTDIHLGTTLIRRQRPSCCYSRYETRVSMTQILSSKRVSVRTKFAQKAVVARGDYGRFETCALCAEDVSLDGAFSRIA